MSLQRRRKDRERVASTSNLGAALHMQIHIGVGHREERTRVSMPVLRGSIRWVTLMWLS